MNWIKDGSTSFAEKTLEKLHERIKNHYQTLYFKQSGILINEGYIYWFQPHYLVKDIMLHREKIYIKKDAEVNYTEEFLNSLKP
jgi:DNA gyrase/topoisomerase IV subunit B